MRGEGRGEGGRWEGAGGNKRWVGGWVVKE